MYSLRLVLITILGLSAISPWLAAEELRSGKVRLVYTLRESDEGLTDRGFSTDGRLLIVRRGKYVRLWDPKERKEVARLTFGDRFADELAVSFDGKLAAASFHQEKEICLFDLVSGKLVIRIPQPSYVDDVMFAADGRTLLSLSNGLRLWDVKTGKELKRLRLNLPVGWEQGYGLAFSPDGKLLAVALEGGSVHLGDVRSGMEVRRLFRKGFHRRTPKLAFSPDGRYLAVHAQEKFIQKQENPALIRFVIRLWDVRSGELVREFKRPIPPAPDVKAVSAKEWIQFTRRNEWDSHSLAFSPDGKTLVSTYTRTQLWEVVTGELRHEFDAPAWAASFSPNGRLLATAEIGQSSPHGHIRLWDWRDPCLEVPKNLAPYEIERLWGELASLDAAVAYRAIAMLLAHPARAVATLREHLQRVEPVAPGEWERLLADLDGDSFSAREKAVKRFAVLGEAARPVLLHLTRQRSTLEVRRRVEDLLPRLMPAGVPERLRRLRAIEVLETIGTEEARQVLVKLASGAEKAVETEDAKQALGRLKANSNK